MSSRRGMALVAALALMTMLGLLVVGAVAATSMAQRVEHLATAAPHYAADADYALTSVLDAPAVALSDLPFGQTTTWVNGTATIAATRIGGGVVWLVAEARSLAQDETVRRANLLVRFGTAGIPPAAAFTCICSRRATSAPGRTSIFPTVS